MIHMFQSEIFHTIKQCCTPASAAVVADDTLVKQLLMATRYTCSKMKIPITIRQCYTPASAAVVADDTLVKQLLMATRYICSKLKILITIKQCHTPASAAVVAAADNLVGEPELPTSGVEARGLGG